MSSHSFQNFVEIGQYLKFHDGGYNDSVHLVPDFDLKFDH